MPTIELPITSTGTFMVPRSLSYLHNYYNIGGFLLPREGMHMGLAYNVNSHPVTDADIVPRGVFTNRDGLMYCIFGAALYRIGGGGTLVLKGAVSVDTVDVTLSKAAAGFTGLVISTGVKNYFIDDATSTLSEITDTDLPDITLDVEYLAGRYVWATSELLYFSDVNDPTSIGALSFFDAEKETDKNKALAVVGNDLFVFGEHSIERFRATGVADSPFASNSNAVIPIGYVGGMIKLSSRVIFIGSTRGGGNAIYELESGSVRIISNEFIDELLNNDELIYTSGGQYWKSICGMSFDSYGNDVVTFSFALEPDLGWQSVGYQRKSDVSLYGIDSGYGFSWGFISDNPENVYADFDQWGIHDMTHESNTFSRRWHFSSSVISDNPLSDSRTYFQRGGTVDSAGLYYKASQFKSLGIDVNKDYGFINDYSNVGLKEPVSGGYRSFFRTPDDKDMQLSKLEVAFSKTGMYRAKAHFHTGREEDANLRLSNTGVGWGYGISGETEGKDWSENVVVDFGNLSDAGRLQFLTSGGLYQSDGYLGYILENSADVPFTIEKVIVT